MSKRLLKFDIVHPKAYLEEKKKKWQDLDSLSAKEYRERLIGLRSNYSDFYTYHLNELGWKAEEFFLLDETYLKKIGEELFGESLYLKKIKCRILEKIRPSKYNWKEKVIKAYIEKFDPDVIFVRSQPLPSSFWQQFRDRSLLVSRLSARLPKNWHPNDWDLIYTDLELFKNFFEAHDVPTIQNKQGFDQRINNDLIKREKKYDVTFVGGMGMHNFKKRTHFFEQIAGKTNFKWWGYWWDHGGGGSINDFPNLKKSFQGSTSGLDMYQVYKDSKIVLNDYVDTSKRIGFNQRMFEVMGIGGFMITREADNLKDTFPSNIFVTFESVSDCVDKINYYLSNKKDREEIAKKALTFVENNYNYKEIVQNFHEDLCKYTS